MWRRTFALALLVSAAPPAAAQVPEYGPPAAGSERVIGGGGEFMTIAGPKDDAAFFNYTDYDRNGLRITRLRLFGEWRPAARVSFVGELRTENGSDLTAPALYGRWRPLVAHDLVIQAGRVPSVVGAFPRHAYGRDNVVLGQPLAYQYLTSLRPDAVPATTDDLIRMRGRGWQPSYPIGSTAIAPGIPLVAVSRWDTGVSGRWRAGRVDLAGAVTRGSPAIPVVKETNDGVMWSGRAGVQLPGGISAGVSAARGQWLSSSVLSLVSDGLARPADQSIVGADAEAGYGPVVVRAEWIRAVFELPVGIGGAGKDLKLAAWSGFAEARYRPHARLQAGLRIERLSFDDVPAVATAVDWDADVDRIEAVLGLRLSRHAELRGGWQQNWREGGRVRKRGLPVVGVLYWF